MGYFDGWVASIGFVVMATSWHLFKDITQKT